jgi:hypothetical protein
MKSSGKPTHGGSRLSRTDSAVSQRTDQFVGGPCGKGARCHGQTWMDQDVPFIAGPDAKAKVTAEQR